MPEAGHGTVTGGGESIVAFERWLETGDGTILAGSRGTTRKTASRPGGCETGCSSGASRRSRSSATSPGEPRACSTKSRRKRRRSVTSSARHCWHVPPIAPFGEQREALGTLANVVDLSPARSQAGLVGVLRAQDEVVRRADPRHRGHRRHRARWTRAREKQSVIYPCRVRSAGVQADASDSPVEDPGRMRRQCHLERLDLSGGRLEPRHRQFDGEPLPTALIAGGPLRTDAQRAALVDLARDVSRAASPAAMRPATC